MVADQGATSVREGERDFEVERVFDAPRAVVWRALTEPDQLATWWGPTGYTTETERMDLRVGGHWKYIMRGPDGHEYPNFVRYTEVSEPECLAYERGETEDTEPACHTNRMTLEELSPTRTKLVMKLTFPTRDDKDRVVHTYGALDGARQTMASLAAHLAGGDNEFVFLVRRVLQAPVELVWQAWTDAEQLMEWFHPEVWKLSVSDMDLRDGGTYHYCMVSDQMPEMWGLWKFRSIRAPEFLEYIVSFSNAEREVVRAPFSETWPLETLSTMTLERHAGIGGGTVMIIRNEPINATDEERRTFRDGMPSMAQGWGQTMESLVAFLAART